MNYTTNFNLNKPEGTDLYNHLTVDNPNMDTIDAAMQANKLASVGAATELISGNIHAITRADLDQNIFKFKATGNFNVGDTITVDGVTVNAYTTAGQPLPDVAYNISAEVLCILDGTSLWVLTNKTPVARDVAFDNNNTSLSATQLQAAVAELDKRKVYQIQSPLPLPTIRVPANGTALVIDNENIVTLNNSNPMLDVLPDTVNIKGAVFLSTTGSILVGTDIIVRTGNMISLRLINPWPNDIDITWVRLLVFAE